ncbi:hypothetical protein DRN43_04660 [Thermococci archaeon]|nr:MAG: hypothetical protein DRN43_04660 [Thermococci archaeon]
MPAVSKAQWKLFKAICEGTYPSGYRGISREVACEFIRGQSPKGLPSRVKKKGRKARRKRRTKRRVKRRKRKMATKKQLAALRKARAAKKKKKKKK